MAKTAKDISEKALLEKELAENQKIIAEGIRSYDALALQLAKDKVAEISRKLYELDHENRKPFIKVASVERPTGNSSVNARRGKKFGSNTDKANLTSVDL